MAEALLGLKYGRKPITCAHGATMALQARSGTCSISTTTPRSLRFNLVCVTCKEESFMMVKMIQRHAGGQVDTRNQVANTNHLSSRRPQCFDGVHSAPLTKYFI